MAVNLGLLALHPLEILGAVVALVVVKGLVLYAPSQGGASARKARSRMAAILSQGGEFAL